MDTTQWPQQGIGVVKSSQIQVERSRVRPHKEQALNCPRCNSTNTKFCYYNNYSLSQPRYFCKTCRRYWTEGGSLRNVPVGGGSRKNKKSSSSSNSNSNSNSNSTPTLPILTSTTTTTTTTTIPSFTRQSLGGAMSALELLRSGITARGLGPYAPVGMPAGPGSMFGFQELMRPGCGNMEEEGNGRILFPFEDLKQVNGSNDQGGVGQGQGDHHTLFWNGNGVGGGGTW